MSNPKRGPYVGGSLTGYGEVYFPDFDWTYNEARTAAAEYADEMIGPWGRSHYDGKRQIQIHDHDDWEEVTEDNCPQPMCWTFSTYEGTARR